MHARVLLPFRRLIILCTFAAWPVSHSATPNQQSTSIGRVPPPAQKIGRPVRIVSLSFNGKSLAAIAEVVDREGAKGVDLIILPETWRGQEDSPESLDGPTVTTMARWRRSTTHTWSVRLTVGTALTASIPRFSLTAPERSRASMTKCIPTGASSIISSRSSQAGGESLSN